MLWMLPNWLRSPSKSGGCTLLGTLPTMILDAVLDRRNMAELDTELGDGKPRLVASHRRACDCATLSRTEVRARGPETTPDTWPPGVAQRRAAIAARSCAAGLALPATARFALCLLLLRLREAVATCSRPSRAGSRCHWHAGGAAPGPSDALIKKEAASRTIQLKPRVRNTDRGHSFPYDSGNHPPKLVCSTSACCLRSRQEAP